ncbi:unnamed protein product [Closterium sp. Yama58-4]|nr:unnamed protein product [Closterium sp. Yama58-4]
MESEKANDDPLLLGAPPSNSSGKCEMGLVFSKFKYKLQLLMSEAKWVQADELRRATDSLESKIRMLEEKLVTLSESKKKAIEELQAAIEVKDAELVRVKKEQVDIKEELYLVNSAHLEAQRACVEYENRSKELTGLVGNLQQQISEQQDRLSEQRLEEFENEKASRPKLISSGTSHSGLTSQVSTGTSCEDLCQPLELEISQLQLRLREVIGEHEVRCSGGQRPIKSVVQGGVDDRKSTQEVYGLDGLVCSGLLTPLEAQGTPNQHTQTQEFKGSQAAASQERDSQQSTGSGGMLSKRRRNSSFKVPLPPANRAKSSQGTDSQGPSSQKIKPPVSSSVCAEPEFGASQFAEDKELSVADSVLPEKEAAHIVLQVKPPPELDVMHWYKDLFQTSQSLVLSPEQLQALTQAQSQKVAKVDEATANVIESESTCAGGRNKEEATATTNCEGRDGEPAVLAKDAVDELHQNGGMVVESDPNNTAPKPSDSITVEAAASACVEAQGNTSKPVPGDLPLGKGGVAAEVAAPSQEEKRGIATTSIFDLKASDLSGNSDCAELEIVPTQLLGMQSISYSSSATGSSTTKSLAQKKAVAAAVPAGQGLAELPESIASFSAQGTMEDVVAIEKANGITVHPHVSVEAENSHRDCYDSTDITPVSSTFAF